MKLTFCGAARCVTGSCHMLTFQGKTLLVDCGMRQGADAKSELGEGDFPFNPAGIDAVLITHAHIDHTGLVPLLVKRGFKGSIFATDATAALCGIMLPDSGHIQEQEAEYTNRKNERAGKPLVEPLYDAQDALNAMKQFKGVKYDAVVDIIPGVRARFRDVGHLLGSAAIELWLEEEGKTVKVAFSGDIGREDRPIICDPESVEDTDYLVMEGTYGDRDHEADTKEQKEQQLARVLTSAIVRGGNIVIPAFAVGRTQELLYYIKSLLREGTVPGLQSVPVYIDSPLGISATDIYEKCSQEYYDDDMKAMIANDGSPFKFPTLRVAQTADESKLINDQKGSNIIISSSGMCDAGRIRHHLKHNLYRADSTIVFTGYQAVGTLGRILLDGVEKVKLFGEDIRVNAQIERIEGFSGHAGRKELIEWVQGMKKKPAHIFLVHGEDTALQSLEEGLKELQYNVEIPELLEEIDLLTAKAKMPAVQYQPKPVEVAERPAATPKPSTSAVESVRRQVQRIITLLDGRKVKDMGLLKIMETDVRQLAEKWEEFLK